MEIIFPIFFEFNHIFHVFILDLQKMIKASCIKKQSRSELLSIS